MTHIFRHPKYYKEMRAKKRKLQAASSGSSEDLPSDKPYQINYDDFCRGDEEEPSVKPQAEGSRPGRPSDK
jgi:hypothetical protein